MGWQTALPRITTDTPSIRYQINRAIYILRDTGYYSNLTTGSVVVDILILLWFFFFLEDLSGHIFTHTHTLNNSLNTSWYARPDRQGNIRTSHLTHDTHTHTCSTLVSWASLTLQVSSWSAARWEIESHKLALANNDGGTDTNWYAMARRNKGTK